MYYILARSLPHIWAHQKALTWVNRHILVEYDAIVEKRLIASFPLTLKNYTSDTARSVLYMNIDNDS
jgi:hypothetical protein